MRWFFIFVCLSVFTHAEEILWELVGIDEIPANPPIPMVILRETTDRERAIQTKDVKAAEFAPKGQSLFLMLRLERAEISADVPVLVEGGLGIVIQERFAWIVKTVWPYESITILSDADFQDRFKQVKLQTLGHYKGDRQPRNTFNGSEYFSLEKDLSILMNASNWNKLSEAQIRRGLEIPSQLGRLDSDWSCGPNSGARALRMLDLHITDLDTFVNQCPKSWSLIWNVGPTPNQLAGHLRSSGTRYHVYGNWNTNFEYLLGSAQFSIHHGLPMIVLIVRSFANMHYVNVIGYNAEERKVAIMDTTNIIYWMTYDELAWWMTAEGHILKFFGWLDNYNGIRFMDPNHG